jgi:uncharacterized protein
MIKRALLMLLKSYRYLLSPSLGSACRFEPTCSLFAMTAIERHGSAAGIYLTLGRLSRCHPWCQGGPDAVPLNKPKLFSGLLCPSFFKKSS